jgi:folate-binding protein YgfZ
MDNNWRNFLHQQGMCLRTDGGIETTEIHKGSITCMTDLGQFASLALAGADARKFLQGQCSSNINHLTPTAGQSSCCCTPKGHVVANFDLLDHNDIVYLHLYHDLLQPLKQHLSKYIVFSKATLADASNQWIKIGVWGPKAHTAVSLIATPPNSKLGVTPFANGMLVATSASADQFMLWCKPSHAQAIWHTLSQYAQIADSQQWMLTQIRQALPWLSNQLSNTYVPQMLNLQATGAVDFNKGCYTGQEIVARMQYLGKLKRHLFLGHVRNTLMPAVGTGLDSLKRRNVGRIVNVAPTSTAAEFLILAVINRAEALVDTINLHNHPSTILTILSLPYTIDPQVFERVRM